MIEIHDAPKGLRLSDNAKRVAAITRRLQTTDGFCPSVPDSIDKEEYLCPCKKAREELKCCCGLYEKE